MRPLVFLLVLGNLTVFALSAGWISGASGEPDAAGSESHQPLSPDRIRIVSRGDPPGQSTPQQCLEWRDISAEQIAELEKLAASHKGLALMREETHAASKRYQVYLPGTKGGKAASEKKTSELKAFGITQYQVVRDGNSDIWNVSLGIYSSEAAAGDALVGFQKRGVRTAVIGVFSETPARFRIRLSGLPAALGPMRKPASLPAPVECSPGTVVAGASGETQASPQLPVPPTLATPAGEAATSPDKAPVTVPSAT